MSLLYCSVMKLISSLSQLETVRLDAGDVVSPMTVMLGCELGSVLV